MKKNKLTFSQILGSRASFYESPEIKPEETNREIYVESKKMAEFLGCIYYPYTESKNIQCRRLGWFLNDEFFGRTYLYLPFYRNFKYLRRIIEKIQEEGYVFKNQIENIDLLLNSKNEDDVLFGRIFKNKLWEECLNYINNK